VLAQASLAFRKLGANKSNGPASHLPPRYLRKRLESFAPNLAMIQVTFAEIRAVLGSNIFRVHACLTVRKNVRAPKRANIHLSVCAHVGVCVSGPLPALHLIPLLCQHLHLRLLPSPHRHLNLHLRVLLCLLVLVCLHRGCG